MKIKVVNKSGFQTPAYETLLSSGMDIRADFNGVKNFAKEIGLIEKIMDDEGNINKIILHPQSRTIIPTKLYMSIPEGYEAQIRPRSGQSIKKGFIIPNAPGTIDADYRGEIGIIVANYTNKLIFIDHGEKIAQMVIAKVEHAELVEVSSLDETERGEGGFGHTGIK